MVEWPRKDKGPRVAACILANPGPAPQRHCAANYSAGQPHDDGGDGGDGSDGSDGGTARARGDATLLGGGGGEREQPLQCCSSSQTAAGPCLDGGSGSE